ncbi:MAG: hypothetical protein JWM86_2027 [Thermoleophilia bacterium]|nr:hypothetical protein [Thermoleophilia bacterium]
MVDFESEALRDGEQAARERQQAQAEMEQTLVAQEQLLERDTGSPIYEQADLSDDAKEDGENVITASHGGGTSGDSMGGATIGSPGAGTDPSETQTSTGDQEIADTLDHGPGTDRNIELVGDERMFEGEGRRPLSEQSSSEGEG